MAPPGAAGHHADRGTDGGTLAGVVAGDLTDQRAGRPTDHAPPARDPLPACCAAACCRRAAARRLGLLLDLDRTIPVLSTATCSIGLVGRLLIGPLPWLG
jgi:hypothetical protein